MPTMQQCMVLHSVNSVKICWEWSSHKSKAAKKGATNCCTFLCGFPYIGMEPERKAMNRRKNVEYSAMYRSLDLLMADNLDDMDLYFEIGRIICDRPEKGAAVIAAEYLQAKYQDRQGFSPQNLRRMRMAYLRIPRRNRQRQSSSVGPQTWPFWRAVWPPKSGHGIWMPLCALDGPKHSF